MLRLSWNFDPQLIISLLVTLGSATATVRGRPYRIGAANSQNGNHTERVRSSLHPGSSLPHDEEVPVSHFGNLRVGRPPRNCWGAIAGEFERKIEAWQRLLQASVKNGLLTWKDWSAKPGPPLPSLPNTRKRMSIALSNRWCWLDWNKLNIWPAWRLRKRGLGWWKTRPSRTWWPRSSSTTTSRTNEPLAPFASFRNAVWWRWLNRSGSSSRSPRLRTPLRRCCSNASWRSRRGTRSYSVRIPARGTVATRPYGSCMKRRSSTERPKAFSLAWSRRPCRTMDRKSTR